jgi:hypothetical protein
LTNTNIFGIVPVVKPKGVGNEYRITVTEGLFQKILGEEGVSNPENYAYILNKHKIYVVEGKC